MHPERTLTNIGGDSTFVLMKQLIGKTGHLSVAPDASDKEAKAERLRRFSELRWSPECKPPSSLVG